MPTAVILSKSKPEVEFQYEERLFFQTGNSYISAVDSVITMKFGLLIETDLLKRATSSDLKPEVKLRRSDCHLENRMSSHFFLRHSVDSGKVLSLCTVQGSYRQTDRQTDRRKSGLSGGRWLITVNVSR